MESNSKEFFKTSIIPKTKKRSRGRQKLVPTQSLFFDVDGTLVLYKEDLNLTEDALKALPEAKLFYFDLMNQKFWLLPHKAHIEKLKQSWQEGYEIVVWSRSSAEWARCVVNHLELNKYVDFITSKPDVYYDDLDVNAWIGSREFIK